jgi:hypothetical protein
MSICASFGAYVDPTLVDKIWRLATVGAYRSRTQNGGRVSAATTAEFDPKQW